MAQSKNTIKDRAGEDGLIRQVLGGAALRSKSEQSRTVEFVASDGSVDSFGTVLPVDKWDLSRYQKNGVVAYMHEAYGGGLLKSADPDDIIGKGQAFIENGQLIVRITFEPADLNPKADKIFRKVMFGTLKAVSVGFLPTKEGHRGVASRGEDPDVYYYDGQELLEVSVVNIPSNANALKRVSTAAGSKRASAAAALAKAALVVHRSRNSGESGAATSIREAEAVRNADKVLRAPGSRVHTAATRAKSALDLQARKEAEARRLAEAALAKQASK